MYLHQFASFSNTTRSILAESQSPNDSDSDAENQSSNDVTDLKLKILEAGLNFVPEHGWNKKSIALGIATKFVVIITKYK